MSLYGEPVNWLATSSFGVLCFLLGAMLALGLLGTRRRQERDADEGLEPQLDDRTSAYIDGLARDWAERTGKSASHADVAGSYAKLAMQLHQRFGGGR